MQFALFLFLTAFQFLFSSEILLSQESKPQKLQSVYPSNNERILLPSVSDDESKETIILQPPKEIIEALEKEKKIKEEKKRQEELRKAEEERKRQEN